MQAGSGFRTLRALSGTRQSNSGFMAATGDLNRHLATGSSRRHSAADQHLVTNLDRAVSHKKPLAGLSGATGFFCDQETAVRPPQLGQAVAYG